VGYPRSVSVYQNYITPTIPPTNQKEMRGSQKCNVRIEIVIEMQLACQYLTIVVKSVITLKCYTNGLYIYTAINNNK